MNKFHQLFVFFALFIVCIGCESELSNNPNPISLSEKRFVGIAVTQASNENFNKAFAIAKQTGINFTTLPINWNDIEKSPEKYNPDINFLKIANQFYPSQNIKIALELNPLDMNSNQLPSDLSDKNIDEPEVIKRFKAFIDWSFEQIPDLELISLSIGNEIDIYLANNAEKWKQYKNFFTEVSAHAKKLRPNLKVGSKITFNGLTKGTFEYSNALNSKTDLILVTYYPLNDNFKVRVPKTVADDFAKLTNLYPNKEIYFLEIGYPSGKLCNSSEEKQAKFIKESFATWDKYAKQIKLLNFTWLTDISKANAQEMAKKFGVANEGFSEFLGTLGLRTETGDAKLALKQLKQEIEKRKMLE